MFRLLLLIIPACWLISATAQETPTPLWQPSHNIDSHFKTIQIQGQQVDGSLYQLDKVALKKRLARLQIGASSVSVSMPIEENRFSEFTIQPSTTFHPDLLKKFPSIQTYEGVSKEHPNAHLRMEWTHKGLFVMIWVNGETKLLQAIDNDQRDWFLLYDKTAIQRTSAFHCATEETQHFNEIRAQIGSQSRSNLGGTLRTYRLALACTGEYAQFHGGSVADALAAVATTMNRVNGIFKRELSLEVQLVPNNDKIIYLDGESDPFENDSGSQMLTANQDVCDEEIGAANYDIGHVFSTGGGGVAYLNSACFDAIKAGGVTGQPMPIGDAYDIDFVTHEMGHQFGATHTQNNDCNRSFASAFEPGSGSTIMSYSGICFPNVQSNSDAYFHGYSLQQISTYLEGAGDSCATPSPTGNQVPTADAGRDYFMPIGTPFELVGNGTDADAGQTLSYNWEQMNNEIASMPPMPTATEGPAFRSFTPQAVPNRYFPSMEWLLSADPSQWEVLPLAGRSMEFRLTVRDNFPEGGCFEYDEMEIIFLEEAGPFTVRVPNREINYAANSTQTVRWEVAGTDSGPINVQQVDILLSIDGGLTYPIVLVENVDNDGVQEVQLPDVLTNQARIKIKSVNHILFDISDENFSIIEAAPDFDVTISPSKASVCRGNAIQFTIAVESVENFNGAITLGTTATSVFPNISFSKNPVLTGESSIMTINSAGVPPGNYNLEINGINGERIKTRIVELSVAPNNPVTLSNQTPNNNATDLTLQPTFEWSSSDATATYLWQLATDPNFQTIVLEEDGIEGTQFAAPRELEHSRTYYWRVQATNQCGVSEFSDFTQFTISNTSCVRYTSTDIPEIIPVQGTPEISSILPLDVEGEVKSIRVLDIEINHSWINDLTATLQSPAGTKVVLFDQICGNENVIDLSFGMEGSAHGNLPCPPESDEAFQSQEDLSILEGEPIAGTWTLLIKDHFNLDGGQLDSWALEVCRVVKENIPLNISINEQSDPSCAGGNDGFIQPIISGGNPPYDILWSSGEERLVIEDLIAGNYSLTVTDADGATSSAQVSLDNPAPLATSHIANSPNCSNGADGNIIVMTSGGRAPYQYEWSHGEEVAAINNLSSGLYTVVITDALRCQITTQIELEEPPSMDLNFQTNDVTNNETGRVDLTVSGGTPPYAYAWSNSINTQNIIGLQAGNYAVTVTDSRGCTQFGQTTIESAFTDTNCQDITVQITLDNYGSETSWDIKNAEGIVFAQGGPYENFTREEVQSATICLSVGCYDFTIYDQWGDGLCCNYGNGKFEVTDDATGEILVTGSKFDRSDKTTFCVSNESSNLISYCGASATTTIYEWIEAVTINGQTFQTGSNGGYFYNRNIAVDVLQGSMLQTSFTPGFGFNQYSENWQVWIDWNRDGDFEDGGEMVFFGSGDRQVIASIEVPSYASVGTTRMRVAMKWGNQIGPCESFNWGEVEDFDLNILPLDGLVNPPSNLNQIGHNHAHEPTTEEIVLFPNPVSERLYIQGGAPITKGTQLTIYNSAGKQYAFHQSDIFENTISVADLPNGVYYLQIETAKRVIRKEFIVIQ